MNFGLISKRKVNQWSMINMQSSFLWRFFFKNIFSLQLAFRAFKIGATNEIAISRILFSPSLSLGDTVLCLLLKISHALWSLTWCSSFSFDLLTSQASVFQILSSCVWINSSHQHPKCFFSFWKGKASNAFHKQSHFLINIIWIVLSSLWKHLFWGNSWYLSNLYVLNDHHYVVASARIFKAYVS